MDGNSAASAAAAESAPGVAESADTKTSVAGQLLAASMRPVLRTKTVENPPEPDEDDVIEPITVNGLGVVHLAQRMVQAGLPAAEISSLIVSDNYGAREPVCAIVGRAVAYAAIDAEWPITLDGDRWDVMCLGKTRSFHLRIVVDEIDQANEFIDSVREIPSLVETLSDRTPEKARWLFRPEDPKYATEPPLIIETYKKKHPRDTLYNMMNGYRCNVSKCFFDGKRLGALSKTVVSDIVNRDVGFPRAYACDAAKLGSLANSLSEFSELAFNGLPKVIETTPKLASRPALASPGDSETKPEDTDNDMGVGALLKLGYKPSLCCNVTSNTIVSTFWRFVLEE